MLQVISRRHLRRALLAPWLLLRRVHDCLGLLLGLGLLAGGCLLWASLAVPLQVLPRHGREVIGQGAAHYGFRLYLLSLFAIGACRFDLSELDRLNDEPPLILAPNHPGMLDAVMIIARVRRLVCVLKASILESVFMGAAARLAGYIPNDRFIGTISLAIDALRRGQHVLLFPEGTRTEAPPVNALQKTVLMVAQRAGVPVQTLIITSSVPFLGKGWGWLRRPPLPMHFCVRLGPRFEPPHQPTVLLAQLHDAYHAALLPEAKQTSPQTEQASLPLSA